MVLRTSKHMKHFISRSKLAWLCSTATIDLQKYKMEQHSTINDSCRDWPCWSNATGLQIEGGVFEQSSFSQCRFFDPEQVNNTYHGLSHLLCILLKIPSQENLISVLFQ